MSPNIVEAYRDVRIHFPNCMCFAYFIIYSKINFKNLLKNFIEKLAIFNKRAIKEKR